MADIFISYSSEDREWVRGLATTLQESGWSVWWDRNIVAGQSFDQVIEHELEIAKSVVVVWSKNSVSSEWVKNEASVASAAGRIVPIQIDPVQVPLEFRRKQTADLVGWDGSSQHEGLQMMKNGIAGITEKAGQEKPQKAPAPTPSLIKSMIQTYKFHLCLGLLVLVAIATVITKMKSPADEVPDAVTQSKLVVETTSSEVKATDQPKQKKSLELSGQTVFPGVVAYLTRFEPTGNLLTLEFTFKNTSTKGEEFCAYLSTYQPKLIDENTGSSWYVKHHGGGTSCDDKIVLQPASSHLVWIKYNVKSPHSKKFTIDWNMLKRPLEGLVLEPKS